MDNTNSHTVAQKWSREYGADTHRDAEGFGKFFLRRSQVRDVNRLAIDDRATGRRATIEDPDLTQTNNHGDGSKMRRAAQQVAIDTQDRDIFSVAEFRRPLGDAVEHGLDIRRRARDHAQDVAGGGLAFEQRIALARSAPGSLGRAAR